MSTEPRTATVNVFVTKPLQIDEPSWCAGHHDNDHAEYKVDISHDGPEHVIAPDGREMFRAFLTQSPFASTDRAVGLYVEASDLTGRLTPAEVEEFADGLTAAAEQLRGLGRQLAGILAQGSVERTFPTVAAFLADEPADQAQAADRCGRCRWTFDPYDKRSDGHARHADSPYCRRCVDNCHDGGTDHVCVICDPKRYGGAR